jgi:uncharacterized protein
MKSLVEFLTKSLVDHPESVVVTEELRGDTIVFHITVDPSDVGKIIGRQGRIAKSIRNLVSAAAYRQKKHAIVEIGS